MRREALAGKLATIPTAQPHNVHAHRTTDCLNRGAIAEQTSPVAVRHTACRMTSLNRKGR